MSAFLKSIVKRHCPKAIPYLRDARGVANVIYYKHIAKSDIIFDCPICQYNGPFLRHSQTKGRYSILYTQCPKCELFERHRLQYLVIEALFKDRDLSEKSILHFAPERKIEQQFKKKFGTHHTTDIRKIEVNYVADICNLPFKDHSYDVIYASHVLEHVKTDEKALGEIKRVLKKDGIAILPVPVVSPHTIEYPEPNQFEFDHVRAVGLDYFERFYKYFKRVQVWSSKDFNAKYQLYTYEDRSFYPTEQSPMRVAMEGEKHPDYVPVCFV